MLTAAYPLHAADEKQDDKDQGQDSSLGSLLKNLKDMKVPDSVSKFSDQLKDLKDAYLETSKTVEELQKEVESLRKEVQRLRENQEGMKNGKQISGRGSGSSSALEIREMTADQLVGAFAEDNSSAKKEYEGRYLKVSGAIQGFQTGVKEIIIFLRAETSDSRVRCSFKRDDSFHAEVVASQGRLVSRNDRTTLLTIGQPVTIVGTCTGNAIDVTMANCHVEGIDAARKPNSK